MAFPQNVTATIGVGNSPAAVAVNPVTSTIYVVNSASDTVSVINGATNTLTTTVNTGTDPVAVAVNPLSNMIYVVNSGSNNVTVINGATNATSTVTDPNAIAPVAVALNPLTNRIYVANGGSNNVTVINGNGNTVAATVGVGSNPIAVAVNPATNGVFVANRASSNVTVINGANNTVVATVGTGTNPVSLSVNTATNTIYVANNGSNNLTAINGATNTVAATVNVGTNPVAVAVNAVTDIVYVANNGSSNVTVVNGANNTVTTTVNAGTGPIAVATDPTTNQIYVGNSASNNITIINGVTNAPTTVTDPNATAPAAVAVDPVTNTVYAANNGSANVSVIDADTNVVTTTINTPTNPVAVALNSVTNTVYVVNSASATVSVINGATNQVVATVNTGTNPVAIAVNPATNMIYVANSGSNTLTVIDGANNSVVATVNIGTDPVAVAVNPVTNAIYVVNNGSGNVTVIDGANNLVTNTVSAGTAPVAVAANPATGLVYVANSGSDNVTAFDPVVSSNVTITDLAASRPTALAVDSSTNKIYVANSYSDNVSVIDGATATVVASINVGDTPNTLALNPATNRIYVTNTGNDTVSVIDGSLLTVIATLNVGTSPSAVSVNPTSNRIYVANNGNGSTDLGSVSIIDGTSNATITTSDSNANHPYALAANPLTDEVYVANNVSSNTSVITAEQAQPNPITVAIAPLPGNQTSDETPTFNFTGTNGFGAWPLDELLFQLDTWQGSWTSATRGAPGRFSGTTTTLLPGFHTIYAYATEGEAATSTITGSQSSPLVGTIAAYGFLVATPLADVAPPTLSFGNQQVGTQSPPQTVTVGNAGSAPLTFTYAVAPGDFSEGSGDTCSSAGGQLAPNTSCTIFIVFKPSASGLENSTLTITDNSNNITGSQQTVSLSGTGTTTSYALNVAEEGSGSGTVTSNPSGISCPSICAANFAASTQVVLTASPNPGSIFMGWSGACTGAGTCTVTLNSNQAVTATFKFIATTSCTGTTDNWIGGASGNWSNPSNWSNGVPNSSSVNVCINAGSSTPSAVTLDISVSVGALYIDSGSSLTISNNSQLLAYGNISNAGQIQVNADTNNTFLTMAAGVSLTGGGTVTLTETLRGGTAALATSGGQQLLTNVNNTLQGVGVIGWNGLQVFNQAGGIINANVTNSLLLNPAVMTNQGLLEATAGGNLELENTYNNAGGRILASGSGSTVQFISGTIQGGTLATASSGVLTTPGGDGITLDGSSQGTLTIAGTYIVANNSTTTLIGTINNTGAIQVNATANNTFMTMATGVSLTGAGTVTLTQTGGGGSAALATANGAQTLTNVNNTLQGNGTIGWNGLVVVNQGTIDANLPALGSLFVNPGGLTNEGLLEATAGATLQLYGTTFNNTGGTILASGNGSNVQFENGIVIQSGTLTANGGGSIGAASGNSLTLDGFAHGPLTIAGTFVGANNSTTNLIGAINNTGTIQVNADTNNTFLTMAAGVSLTGAGTVTLTETLRGGTAALATSGGQQLLTNVDNNLQGVGVIGWNGLEVLNEGAINANVPGGTLTLNPSVFTNQGLLEATTGGTLVLSGSTINNQKGTIQVNGAASTVQFINGERIEGGTLASTNGGLLTIPGGYTITLDGSTLGTLTITGTYVVANNSTTDLVGTINNTGAIQVNADTNNTFLTMAAGVSLTGGGAVTLTETLRGGTAALATSGGQQLLTNVNNTLQGIGVIGYNGLQVTNQGTIDANVPGLSLTLNPSVFTNQGLLEATSGGILALSGSTISNRTGTIQVNGSTSTVQFVNSATIQSGTLATVNNGVLTIPSGNSITLDGSTLGTLTIAGAYVVANNSTTNLLGTINNTGTIQVNATANNTFLTMVGPVSLTGGGTVTLTQTGGGGTAALATSGGQQVLTNVTNTLQGTGTVGWNGLQVLNQGAINANVSGSLFLNPSVLTNQGLMEATAGGTLTLSSSTINNGAGTIQVSGATSTVQFVNGATIQGGTLAALNSGVLTIPSGNSITFDGASHGALTIAGTYVGANNSTTNLIGAINNTGVIQLNADTNNTFLTMAAGVSLTGVGTVTLTETLRGGTAALATSGSQQLLTNVSNTLQGIGVIGWNGLQLLNQGTINANAKAGTLTLNPGVLTNQGLLEATGSTLQVNTTVSNTGGTILANGSGAAVQFANTLSIQGGTLNAVGGGFLGSASGNFLTLDGTANAVSIAAGGTYTVGNNSTTNIQGTINNSGTILLDSTGNTTVLGDPTGSAMLTGTGAVTMTSGANLISGPSLVNAGNAILDSSAFSVTAYTQSAGLLQVTAPASALVSSFNLNGGLAQVDGDLSLSSGLNMSGSGTISGIGQITGNVTNSGVAQAGDIPNPGILTISGNGFGNYNQNSAGAYDVVIGGLTAGTQYSQLNVASTAALGGTLNVSLINGFAPSAGNQFTILNAGTLTGQFVTTNLPALPPGLNWSVGYNANSVVLSVIQSVSTYTLTVTTLGTGDGSVTDNFGEINCVDTAGVQTGTCSAIYNAGTTVNLTATPVQPTTFGGWGGACSGTAGCSVLMNSNQSVTASFVPVPTTLPVPFTCPGGVYPCVNVTAPPAVFNCPSGIEPCPDPNAHSLTLNTAQLNTPFTLTVAATEVPMTQADGDCQSGQTPATDFDCRFTSFFPYEKLGNGDIIVPICDAYSNGNCVFYSVYFGSRGIEPPTSDYDGPITWTIAWNNTSFLPPTNYPYQANNPQLYDDPDYEVSPTTPYGTNCNTPMLINGIPTNPPIYCQFVFDITDYFNPQQPPDAAIGGRTKQFNDVVVAFPLNNAVPNLSVTKTADQSVVKAGNPIGYTVNMGNSSAPGTGTATNAVLNDPLPAGAAVNWTISPPYAGPGTCTITGAPPSQTLSCSLGNLSPAITTSVHVSSSNSSVGTYLNTATLSADNNPPQTSSATIQVTGTGPIANLKPQALDFGDQKVGTTSKPRSATLTNIGTGSLNISSLNIDGDFAFASGTTCSNTTKLSHGESCVMQVTFTPKKTGKQACRVIIQDNAATGKQELMLYGTGD